MADVFVPPSARNQVHNVVPIEVPERPQDAAREGKIGRLVATWEGRRDRVAVLNQRHYELQQRLQACERLLATAGPEAEMLEVAQAAAAVPILRRALAADAAGRIGDQEAADAARMEMEAAWTRMTALVSHWQGRATARDRDGHSLSDEAVILELAELLGDAAVPAVKDARRRRKLQERILAEQISRGAAVND